jgi:hypothetical protein
MFLIKSKFKRNQFLIYVIIISAVAVTVIMIKDKYILMALGFLLTAREINIKELLKLDVFVKIVTVIMVISLCKAGIFPNFTKVINGAYKEALGFSHPNVLTAIVLSILVEWIYLKYDTLRIKDYILVLLSVLWVWNVAASRSSVYSFVLYFLFVIFSKKHAHIYENKLFITIISLLSSVIAVLSFILLKLYNKGNSVVYLINEILTRRIYQASKLIDKYGVSLFGQFINVRGTRSVDYSSDALFSVDMSYIVIPIRYGLVIFVLLLVGYFILTRKASSINKALVPAILYYVILGFAETYFYRIQYNFTLMYLFVYVGVTVSESKKIKANKSILQRAIYEQE